MPIGRIMVLGQDYHCLAGYQRVLKMDGENLRDATWRNLRKILEANAIDPSNCFFTNLFMGVREADKPCGLSPAARDAGFLQRCRTFFLHQLRVQKPALVMVLGIQVCRLLAPLSPAMAPWQDVSTFFQLDSRSGALIRNGDFNCGSETLRTSLVALTHPCMRGSNVRRRCYAGDTGDAAEHRMLADARNCCPFNWELAMS
jgi:hypothetical protein